MTINSLRKFALALPEVTEQPHFHLSSFRVAGKIFVTVPPEMTHVHVFVGDNEREPALAHYPEFVEKLWWGKKICGVRIAMDKAQANVVKSLVRAAWAEKAPKRLIGREASKGRVK
jgi:hypothetical protein